MLWAIRHGEPGTNCQGWPQRPLGNKNQKILAFWRHANARIWTGTFSGINRRHCSRHSIAHCRSNGAKNRRNGKQCHRSFERAYSFSNFIAVSGRRKNPRLEHFALVHVRCGNIWVDSLSKHKHNVASAWRHDHAGSYHYWATSNGSFIGHFWMVGSNSPTH